MTATYTLRELDTDLWVADAPHTMLGLHIGTRMTVVRLANTDYPRCRPDTPGLSGLACFQRHNTPRTRPDDPYGKGS